MEGFPQVRDGGSLFAVVEVRPPGHLRDGRTGEPVLGEDGVAGPADGVLVAVGEVLEVLVGEHAEGVQGGVRGGDEAAELAGGDAGGVSSAAHDPDNTTS